MTCPRCGHGLTVVTFPHQRGQTVAYCLPVTGGCGWGQVEDSRPAGETERQLALPGFEREARSA